MIDTKALRSRVLELAIQGKLTEQLAEDGTAEELYQQIQAEKQRLIKEGKIKREKPLPKIKPEDVPFKIPGNWKWVRLDEVFTLQAGKFVAASAIHETESADNPFKCYGGNGIRGYVSEYNVSGAHALIGRQGALCGNINFAEDLFYATEHAVVVYHYANTDVKWVFHALKELNLNQYATSVAQPGLAVGKIGKVLLPLPPLAEQKRIVARVEEIFRLLDIIDAAQEQYAADAESLKAKLITLGIQGRLTEQLAEDGTAEELYQQIQAEKQRLIKEGKIKKEKPLPEIKPEEVPFEIPGNWKWVYLGELFQHNTGKALNSANTEGTMLDYITTSNVYWDRFELKKLKQMRFTEDEIDKCTVTKGDLLICEGGDIGRSAIWCYDYDIRIQNHLHRLRGYVSDISAKYYYYLMMHYKETGKIDGRGIGLQGFSSKRVHSLVVPLPPLAEQKRIADRLEELLGALA